MPAQQHFTPSRHHSAALFTYGARQELPQRPPQDRLYTTNSIRTRLQAELKAATDVSPEVESKIAPAATPEATSNFVNIFEEPLEKCIEDDYCTYRSALMADHDMCAGIRLTEDVKDRGMSFKAGPVDE